MRLAEKVQPVQIVYHLNGLLVLERHLRFQIPAAAVNYYFL